MQHSWGMGCMLAITKLCIAYDSSCISCARFDLDFDLNELVVVMDAMLLSKMASLSIGIRVFLLSREVSR